MGKNYTLYIHQLAFANEQNKSGLVNRLLENHYGTGFFLEEPVKIIRNARATSLKERAEGMGESVELPPTTVELSKSTVFAKGYAFCKHGADPKLCKFAKKGKVCK